MEKMQKLVRDFHDKFSVPVHDEPALRERELRASLIAEEAKETCDAILSGDLTEAIDGLCDTIYVCMGAALTFGVDLEPFFDEVHRTNMLKEGGRKREDGKILKPDGWKPPKIKMMLDRLNETAAKRNEFKNDGKDR